MWHLIPAMRLLMSCQLVSPSKSHITYGADKWFAARVNQRMAGQVTLRCKCLWTLSTCVRSHATVDPCVFLQIGTTCESFQADAAYEWSSASVDNYMLSKIWTPSKCFTTCITHKWTFTCMSAYVCCQCWAIRKWLPTHAAPKRTLPCMYQFMAS